MSFARRIVLGTALAATLPLLFALLIYLNQRETASLTHTVISRDRRALTLTIYLERLIVDMENSVRVFRTSGREDFLEAYRLALREYAPGILELERLLPADREKKLLGEIRSRVQAWREEWAEPRIGHTRKNPPQRPEGQVLLVELPVALEAEAGKLRMDAIRRLFDSMSLLQREKLDAALDARERAEARLSRLLWIAAAGFSILLIAAAAGFLRTAQRRIRLLFEGMESAERGEYRPVLLDGEDEPARVARAFNRMVGEVERRDEELRRALETQRGLVEDVRRTESFLQSIIENIPNMVFVKDPAELRFLRFNRAGEELTGLPREELLGRNDYDLFPKEQADFFVAKDREVLESCKLVDIPEEPIQTRHQGTRLLHTTKIPILDGSGRPRYLLGISEDITERKRAEEQIARFFSVSLDLLCIADFDGYFKRLNPAWEKTLGFATSELLSKPFIEFVHPEDREATLAEAAKLGAQEHETVAFANRYRCADGSYRWLLWSSRSDHRYRLIYAAARDVTEEKRTQEQIRELNEELRHRLAELDLLNKELEAFSYSVSHDLRAPLRHVSGFAELLIKHSGAGLDERGRRFLDTISESAKRMGYLIDDLLVFSRMGRAEMRITRVSMATLLDEVRRDLQAELAGREVVWNVNGLPEVRGDPTMLRLVLVNLLSNALKYTSTRPKTQIEIGSYPEADETVFFIRDNGVGFDMKYADKLFGVFQRLHRAEEFEGTGIGLANVRRIVHRHGGRTWAEGAAGAGAVFYFSLPHMPESDERPEEAS